MAHFAKLDETNIVIDVIKVHNNELMDNGVADDRDLTGRFVASASLQ